jgi:4a-hydroxytetrahydrobiopterin dehydratase
MKQAWEGAMARLSDEAVQAAVSGLHGWKVSDGELAKTYTFGTFPGAIAFVTRVAALAEEAGHHPDIDIRYANVTMRLSTHSAGGITEHDVALARGIDGVVEA